VNDLVKAKSLQRIVDPVQGAAAIKTLNRAVALARAFGMKKDEVNEYAENLVRHVRKTGELIDKLPDGRGKKLQPIAVLCKKAEIAERTAFNWQSVFTGHTDPEFEEKIAELRELDVIAVSDFYRRAVWREKLTPPLPDGKYRVIYADPPWEYGDS
jgi:hypothetical protein